MRRLLLVLLGLLIAGTGVFAVPAASASGGSGDDGSDAAADQLRERSLVRDSTDAALESERIAHLGVNPSQAGISGCFLKTAPLFVTSGIDTLRVWNVADPAKPRLVGTLVNALFENEAMNCGERRTSSGIKRFALVGVDLVSASPDDIEHSNLGGGELIVVDVTKPSAPRIYSRAPGSTSTHTVACVDQWDCDYAYSAGENESNPYFSVFDLRNLYKPREVDSNANKSGLQPFWSPTAGHKWNFDSAGIGTHTGWGGASMWDTTNARSPRLLATTGKAGRGADPRYAGWNDFILHNAFRPNGSAFRPNTAPSLANGNILLVTEEDYEQTDCAKAGSFQTWWVKELNAGTRGFDSIVPLDKVELSDLGNFPSPQGAFCSSHWFDYHGSGLVAAGFYGGGTQILDVRNPRVIKPYAHSIWGTSEVWDAMWVPAYKNGRMTGGTTNVVYSIDLVRGLDVYAVDVPGDGRGALPPASSSDPSILDKVQRGATPLALVLGAMFLALGLRRRRPRGPDTTPALA